MISRKPRLIAKCADAADVMTAVASHEHQGLQVSVRGGGHNAGGLGVCDDGLVIDLPASVTSMWIRRRARCASAAARNWGDVDHATHAFGLAVPSGIISSTGVGGLTLGGGIGHLTRKYGLTIDNLLAADVVLADGTFVVASAEENPRSVLGDSRRRRQFRRGDRLPVPGASGAHGRAPGPCCGNWTRPPTS